MNIGIGVLIFVIGALLGAVAGFFGARAYMKKYFEENPPVNEDMLKYDDANGAKTI